MKKIALGLLLLLALTACSNASSVSIEGAWKLVSYGSTSNQTPALPDVETSLEFGADGNFRGNVGCNRFEGGYAIDGDAITFSTVAITEMFCGEPINKQETGTIAVFQESAALSLSGETLTITSAEGNSSIVLTRK